ncbi:hypothetical protein ACFQLX_13635 [Streptomyces polyrhachis]|uniref:Methyltransferase type 11 domain-containing protein n=1 Tax=Streptomyces polyrhachis TaxID=1282885 RepID=A0ABW2GEP2_9ACTN
MRQIDCDTGQHRHYARGRALGPEQLRAWLDAFEAVLPERRPLAGLDVGSGTGRFSPALAEAFGPLTGVEPSVWRRPSPPTPTPRPRSSPRPCSRSNSPRNAVR